MKLSSALENEFIFKFHKMPNSLWAYIVTALWLGKKVNFTMTNCLTHYR